MENVILIGSGQHCKVVLYNIEEEGKYNPVAILDSDLSKKGAKIWNVPIEGDYSKENLVAIEKKYHTRKFIIAFGSMKYRKGVFEYMCEQGWDPITIIHPSAVVSSHATIGKGVLIEACCMVAPDPVIGDNVVINMGAQVNHDCVVGKHVFMASSVILSGGVTVKENTLLDDGVIVTKGRTVGANCIVGAGAVVTKNITDGVVAYGVPAVIKRNND